MLQGFDVLYFSADDWGCGLTTSQTHIARILAKNNRVLYINSLGLRRPHVSSGDMGRIWSKMTKFFKGVRQEAENIWVFTPVVLPFHDSQLVQKINSQLLLNYLRLHIKRLSMKSPIFWSFLPNAVHLVGKFNEQKVIYYCVDEYSQFDGVPREAIIKQEQMIIGKANFVFASAKTLYENKRKGNPNTFYIPHGVDVQHFTKALNPKLEVPDDIKNIPRPIIGFYGLIESWIDLKLIAFAAKKRPDWSFVMIGDRKTDTQIFSGLDNVYLLGKKNYDDLPAYNKAFDVALIPFVINELTRNVNPIKFKEYLAAGSPVVSTRLPEMEKYENLAYLVDDNEDFVNKIQLALNDNGPLPLEERLKFIREESWESRLEYISQIILNSGCQQLED